MGGSMAYRTRRLRAAIPAAVLISLTLGGAGTDRQSEPPMSAVQAALFDLPNSLSNAWADFDNDGDLDLAVSSSTGLRLYRNDASGFVRVGESLGLPAETYEIRGLSWGDYDGDGWVDLIAGPI